MQTEALTTKESIDKTMKNLQVEREFKPFEFPKFMSNRDMSHLTPKEKMWETDPEQIKAAYFKLIEMWNKDGKARGFVKHLVAAFLPYQNFNRLMNVGKDTVKCAILNCEVLGISEISQHFATFSTSKMFIDAKCMTENREKYTDEEITKIEAEKKKMPDAARHSRVGIGSDKSDKILLVESNIGLMLFAQDMIMTNNREFEFLVNKMRINTHNESKPKEKQLTPKEVNLVSKATSFGVKSHLKESTFSALEKLKANLEKQENSEK